jgi:hypothetical protein
VKESKKLLRAGSKDSFGSKDYMERKGYKIRGEKMKTFY